MTKFDLILQEIEHLPILMKIIWVTTIILALTIIVLSIYLKTIRFHLRKKENETIAFRNMFEANLIEYLYSGDTTGKLNEHQIAIIEKLKVSIPNPSKRKIIVSILYNLINEVSGEMSDAIKTLYYKSGLIDYTLKRLDSKEWHIIAKGIGELRRFKIEEVGYKVSKLVNHPRTEVRQKAQLYLVSLFKFEGLSFLNNLTTPLSEWAQIQLLETLQKFDDQQICDIKPWLKSTNNYVVLFALKLAKVYNQFEVQDTLMELLSHPNKDIRIITIQTLTHLYGIEAKELLKANFTELSLEEQICFFGMLEKLVVPSDEPFVEKYLFHKNFEIQLLALKILKSINIDKYLSLSKKTNNDKDSSMIKLVSAI